ncbi:hypothetical protein QA641_06855 [Bradyrhizobium sp. CB1650]|uniref:hypothetical protein n=1 Tax=Bradyrhizobium sp. CB1650 TaxID=3039153 RepID=UPI0024354344|nr:hypothetical protein [Bradyrhizobium sp. CB1650]WGD53616.1 hypothetical protein QA641_06855 [Bradyrhizobium sp. CB1650]
MVGMLGAARVAVGSVLARGAQRYATRTETLEAWAGALVVLGFGLLGSALPHVH